MAWSDRSLIAGHPSPLMRTTTIRFLDYWLGVPACAVLTLVRRLQDIAASKGRPKAPRKVLFLKFIEQGGNMIVKGGKIEVLC